MGPADERMTLPLRTPRRATPGAVRPPAAMGQAGPALIVAMTTPVTPCGDIPHPTVLDPWAPTDHPAARGGDVGGPDEIPVAAEPAGRTAKDPPPRLGDPPPAAQAGRGGPPLVDLHHLDARHGRLVLQGSDQMGAPPPAKPQVLAPAHVPLADPLGVPDPERPHPVVDRPGDDRLRRLVLRLADATAVAGLLAALGPSQLAPALRPLLAPAGGLAPHPPVPRLGVGEVQVALGPQTPSRDEESFSSCDDGEGMDDAGVHPGDDPRVEVVVLRAQGSGHVDIKTPRLTEQGERADGPGRVGDCPGEAHHQGRGFPSHRDPEAVTVDAEGPVVPAHRKEGPLSSGG